MKDIESIYFLGIGGIGMSNLARYFISKKKKVAGYDRTETALTKILAQEGADIHYTDNINAIPDFVKNNKEKTLVIYTPAVPANNKEFTFFQTNGFTIQKRAQALGIITEHSKALCCAGTHGKTTTSSMLAHIFTNSGIGCNAFLGGILKNYNTNLLLSDNSEYTVVEADEYDRSFHWLHPYMTLITSVDPDHLDIYGNEEEYLKSFEKFTTLIQNDGALVIKHNIKLHPKVTKGVKIYSYSIDKGDFRAQNIRIGNGQIFFDFVTPTRIIKDINLGVPIKINIENAIGAMAIAYLNNIPDDKIKSAIHSFQGARRRFDVLIKTDSIVLVDDYAHHPNELAASIDSIKSLYQDKKVTGIFQPHLFSRTRDFATEFADSLSKLDELYLLDIYPARELPIEGVTSKLIFDQVKCKKTLCKKEDLLTLLKQNNDLQVVLIVGAGDIEQLREPIKKILESKT